MTWASSAVGIRCNSSFLLFAVVLQPLFGEIQLFVSQGDVQVHRDGALVDRVAEPVDHRQGDVPIVQVEADTTA